ncbi:hypothetical protein [Phyllobacterium chamaecytisi]|nr:hypothetical protein [Phyllobacterium sp. KW56]
MTLKSQGKAAMNLFCGELKIGNRKARASTAAKPLFHINVMY